MTAGSADSRRLISSMLITDELLRKAQSGLIDKREGEFDFAGVTWRVRDTITDELGAVSYRCERVQ